MNNIEVKTIYGRIEDFLRLSANERLWAGKPIMSADISTAARILNRR